MSHHEERLSGTLLKRKGYVRQREGQTERGRERWGESVSERERPISREETIILPGFRVWSELFSFCPGVGIFMMCFITVAKWRDMGNGVGEWCV